MKATFVYIKYMNRKDKVGQKTEVPCKIDKDGKITVDIDDSDRLKYFSHEEYIISKGKRLDLCFCCHRGLLTCTKARLKEGEFVPYNYFLGNKVICKNCGNKILP